MSWLSLQPNDVRARLSGPELTALQSAALADGQTDPLPEILAATVDEVRGYIAAHPRQPLEPGHTIPPELLAATLDLIRQRLASRLPLDSLLTEARTRDAEAARALLERVALGTYQISGGEAGHTPMPVQPSITGRERVFDRDDQNGI